MTGDGAVAAPPPRAPPDGGCYADAVRTPILLLAAALAVWAALGPGRGGSEPGAADPVERARGAPRAQRPALDAPPAPAGADTSAGSGPDREPAPAPDARPPEPPAGSPGRDPRAASAPVRMEGVALDALGVPVAGARVRPADAGGDGPEATTDEEGRFRLDLPAPGAFALIALPPDAALPLPAPAPPRLTLTAGPSLSGRVVDALTGEPIAGASVQARPATSPAGPGLWSARSAPDGSFTLVVPSRAPHALRAEAPGLGGPQAPDGWVAATLPRVEPGSAPATLSLARALSIEGRLVDDAGEPVRVAVRVRAVGLSPSGAPDFTRRAQALATEGGLRLTGLAPGRYDLDFLPAGEGLRPGEALPLAAVTLRGVEAGARGLTVRLPTGRVLEGRLVDPAGAPVRGGGRLLAVPAGAGTEETGLPGALAGDGAFRVGPLDDGLRYDLFVRGVPGHRDHVERGVEARAEGLVLRLTPGSRIAGSVRLQGGRAAPAGVPVSLLAVGAAADLPGARVFVFTDASGAFVADGLLDLPYDLEAGGGASGYLGPTVRAVAPGTQGLSLRAVEGVTLSGTLVDADGAPMAATSLQGDDGMHRVAMRPYALVGPDGRFLLSGLSPGPVRLSVRTRDGWREVGEAIAPATQAVVRVGER